MYLGELQCYSTVSPEGIPLFTYKVRSDYEIYELSKHSVKYRYDNSTEWKTIHMIDDKVQILSDEGSPYTIGEVEKMFAFIRILDVSKAMHTFIKDESRVSVKKVEYNSVSEISEKQKELFQKTFHSALIKNISKN